MAPRNVVLVCLDTARKDYFDEHATRLRAGADVSYEACRAASGWSVPSHASMMTGELPSGHGIHVYNRDFSGLDRSDTFLGDLPDHAAVGTSANVYASDAFGFDGLFDDFVSVSPDRRFPEGMDVERWGQECDAEGLDRYVAFLRSAMAHERPLRSLANGVLVEIDDRLAELPIPKLLDDGARIVAREALRQAERTPEPFVMFTNFMDVHAPLAHVRGYDRTLHDAPLSWTTGAYNTHEVNVGDVDDYETELAYTRGLYAAATDYVDRRVATFVDRLHETTDRETTVVVTSDHGENLGFEADGGLLAHKGVLTEGLLHVPLEVLNAPADAAHRGSVDRYVSHLRLGDLVVALADGRLPDVTADRIPAERIGSNMAGTATEAERAEWDRMIRVVYDDDGTTKYEWDSQGDRSRHRLDPDRPNWQERLDDDVPVDDLEPAFFDEPIEAYKRRAVAGRRDDPEVDRATAERLADLGYV